MSHSLSRSWGGRGGETGGKTESETGVRQGSRQGERWEWDREQDREQDGVRQGARRARQEARQEARRGARQGWDGGRDRERDEPPCETFTTCYFCFLASHQRATSLFGQPPYVNGIWMWLIIANVRDLHLPWFTSWKDFFWFFETFFNFDLLARDIRVLMENKFLNSRVHKHLRRTGADWSKIINGSVAAKKVIHSFRLTVFFCNRIGHCGKLTKQNKN